MKQTTDELLGSRIGAALTACGSKLLTKTKSAIRHLIRGHRHLHINNNQGGCINLFLVDYSMEEIKQLIMDNHGTINSDSHE